MPHSDLRFGLTRFLVAFGALLILRLLAADFGYFFEQDEMSIANGVAALLSGRTGYLYHYGPQVGYYWLMRLLAGLAGGIAAVPLVMSASSAVAGAVIPAATFFAFRDQFSDKVRALAAAVAACSPVLWISSQYGNTAIVSTAFVAVGLVILSNRPKPVALAGALALCVAGVLVRADAVLMAPVVALLVVRATRDSAQAAKWLVSGAVGFVVVWLGIRALDPQFGAGAADVVEHFADPELRSTFFESLLWGVSPFVLALALLGARRLLLSSKATFWALAVWILPVWAFYFASTTTPRYFLLASVPISLFAAAEMVSIASSSSRPRLAWAAVTVVAFAHLFVGLGHFAPADWTTALKAPSYDTADGPMPTGALVYQGYHRGLGVFGSSLRSGGWGSASYIALGLDPQLERLAESSPAQGPRRVYALIDAWNGHVFYFHALQAGATIVGHEPGNEWMSPAELLQGNVTVMVVGVGAEGFDVVSELDVVEGDEVWHVSPEHPFMIDAESAKLPAHLELVGPVADTGGSSTVVYSVRRRQP